MSTIVVLRRELIQVGGKNKFCVSGEYVAATRENDVEIDMGPVTGTWWDVPLPPCPDCGGAVVWYEAGYVPGTRKCVGQPIREENGQKVYSEAQSCGSLFSVRTITR